MNLCNFARRAAFAKGLLLAVVTTISSLAFGGERFTLNFNPDWKFIKADPTNAQAPAFNDRDWKSVSAPHTYNDVDTFDNFSIPGHRGEQVQWGGRTWYRKTFTLPESAKGKKVFIEFEGVRQIAEVYLNGKLLGTSKTGFIPFGFDLTPYLQFGKPNVLAVMCDNRFMKDPLGREGNTTGQTERPTPKTDLNIAPTANPNLAALQHRFNQAIPEDVEDLQADQIPWNNPHWHPAHGGIYRNVRLYITDPLHISLPLYSFLQTAGPYVYSTDISDKKATVNVEVPIENGRRLGENVEVVAQVLDRNNKPVLTLKHGGEVVAGASATFKMSGALDNPQLWEPGYPYLYRIVCALRVNGETVDTAEIPFGIRTVQWTTDQGFFINGHHLKLHGWGQKPTDEWPGLGAAQPNWLHFYTLELMREAGGNWVRWGHCAGGPSLIEASDRLGIMVEQPGLDGESDTRAAAWKLRASGFRDMIIYFRNNPSILIWEGGNQKVTHEHAAELRGYMDKYDPHGGRAYAHRRSDKVVGEFMDVCIGTEGGWELKNMAVVEGEYDREESPRRVWDKFSPPNFGYPEAVGKSDYVLTSEEYALNQVPQYYKKIGMPEHCGGANWIFSDSTSGGRDAAEVTRASGEVDGARLPKEAYYVCQAIFSSAPQVHIIGHWTYPAGTKKTVYVASSCGDVELFLNGKSLGHGEPYSGGPNVFVFPDVTFQPGELKAVAYAGGKSVVTHVLKTAGPPVALRLTAITGPDGLRADGSDVALIDVEAVDAKGNRCPTFQQRVDFETSGPAIWRGGYNSGKTNSINNTFLDLECGINRVAVRATRTAGTITVRAKSHGLRSGRVKIKSVAFKTENGASKTEPVIPEVHLPKERPISTEIPAPVVRAQKTAQSGQFIKEFSYSGPTAGAHIERDAQDGKNIFADSDWKFESLPTQLKGADYLQVPNADKRYNAVDLMELAVKAGTTVFVAHDERLDRPDWLTRQFDPTTETLTVNGAPMKIYQHRSAKDESLTLGTNTENAQAREGNMYVVFAGGK